MQAKDIRNRARRFEILLFCASLACGCTVLGLAAAAAAYAQELVIQGSLLPALNGLNETNTPAVLRNPEVILGRKVTMDRGAVTDNPELIIDQDYYVLNENAVGLVVKVTLDPAIGVWRAAVVFDSLEGWERIIRHCEVADGKDEDGKTKYKTVPCPPFVGNKRRVGYIQEKRDDGSVVAVLPVETLGFERPRAGGLVSRSYDWADGYIDGYSEPLGGLPKDVDWEDYQGKVLTSYDPTSGLVEVLWSATGRRSVHRFGIEGFYDIEMRAEPEVIEMALDVPTRDNGSGTEGSAEEGSMEPGSNGGPTLAGRGGSIPPSGSAPGSYGSSPPQGSAPGSYGSSPPPGSAPGSYGSQPPGSSPQSYGSGSMPQGSSPQSYGSGSPGGEDVTAGENAEMEGDASGGR